MIVHCIRHSETFFLIFGNPQIMKPINKNVGKLFLTLFLILCGNGQVNVQDITNEDSTVVSNAVVELTVFYDKDALKLFNNCLDKLTTYWKALVWDLHLKFQSVPNVNISFRLKSIFDIGTEGQRQLIESARKPDGSLSYNLLSENWAGLYKKIVIENEIFYDIAVLAVGSNLEGGNIVGYNYQAGVCVGTSENEQHMDQSLAILSMRGTYLGKQLTQQIAILLNAPEDNKESYEKFNCGEYDTDQHLYVMASTERNILKQLFSNCSATVMKEFVESKWATCLKQSDNSKTPMLDTASKCDLFQNMKPLDLEEQCELRLNGTDLVLEIEDENECEYVHCHLNLTTGMDPAEKLIQPLAGSHCLNGITEGFCYLGHCIPMGGYLFNVGSRLCLENKKPLLWTNKTGMYNCLDGRSSTPLDFVRIDAASKIGVHIKFSGLNNITLDEKCLAQSRQSKHPHFEKCAFKDATHVWEPLYFNGSVLLKHVVTERCLMVGSSRVGAQLTTNSSCSSADRNQLWKFVNEKEFIKLLDCKLQEPVIETKVISISSGGTRQTSYVPVMLMVLVHQCFWKEG